MARTIQRLAPSIALVVLVFAAAAAPGDVTIKMESEMTSPAGKQTTPVTQYYTPTKMRNEYGDMSVTITDLKAACTITLMPAAKMFTRQTFEAMRQMAASVRLAARELKIEETDEQETIGDYECHKVNVRIVESGRETVTEYWVAKDVEGLDALKAFFDGMAEAFKDSPLHQRNSEVNERLAGKGYFPIRTVIRRPEQANTVITMTVTKIEEGDLDEALFEVPDDYKEADFGGPGGSH